MSDEEFEYVNEDGNVIDPSEIGDDYEIVEEVEQTESEPVPVATEASTPATESPAVEAGASVGPVRQVSRKVVVLGAVAVVVVGIAGALVFSLSQIGSQNTASDVRDAVQGKVAAASSSVAAKSSEVQADLAAIDVCTIGVGTRGLNNATQGGDLALKVLASTPLPRSFVAARTNADGVNGTAELLQLGKNSWGVYTTTPLTKAEKKAKVDRPAFWKADAVVTDDSVKITGDRAWPGGDVAGAGACEPGKPGAYQTTGAVPADAAGLVDGVADVSAIVGVAGSKTQAVAVMGDSVVLVEAVDPEKEGADK